MWSARDVGRYAWAGVKLLFRGAGALIAAALGAFFCLVGLSGFKVPAAAEWSLVTVSAAAAGAMGWWSFTEAIYVIGHWFQDW